jgi:photosystem II stability/assembly factor-like uncharacterized protein
MRNSIVGVVLLVLLISTQVMAWEIVPGRTSVCAVVTDSQEQRMIVSLRYGGYWLSNDGGESWEPISDAVYSEHRARYAHYLSALDAAADTVITRAYFGAYPGNYLPARQVAMTTDGGQTWSLPIGESNSSDFLIFDRSNHQNLFFTTTASSCRSIDLGETWEPYVSYDPYASQNFSFSQDVNFDSTLYVTCFYQQNVESGVFRSMDKGETWHSFFEENNYYTDYQMATMKDIDRLSNNDLLVTVESFMFPSGSAGSFLRSMDNGETWNEEYPLPSGFWPAQTIELRGDQGHLLVRGRYDQHYVYQSTDYGHSFSPLEPPARHDLVHTSLLVNNEFNSTTYAATWGNGAWKTTDHGQTWNELPIPPYSSLSHFHHDAEFVSHVSEEGLNVFLKRESDPEFFSFAYPYPTPDSLQVALPVLSVDDNTIRGMFLRNSVETNEGFLYVVESVDDGQTWSEPLASAPVDGYLSNNAITFSEDEGQEYIIISAELDWLDAWVIYVSDDGGINWTAEQITDLSDYSSLYCVKDGYIYASRRQVGISRRPVTGGPWEHIGHQDAYQFTDPSAIVFSDSDDTFYTFSSVFGYRYSGGVWETLGLLPFSDIHYAGAIPQDGQEPVLFVSSSLNSNLYLSYDGGYEWDIVQNPLPFSTQMSKIENISYDPHRARLWINTPLGLMWEDASVYVTVSESDSQVPETHDLLHVYPNPFNAQSTVTVHLDKTDDVTLTLFNTLGQEVRTLVDERLSAGEHSVSIDGSSLASGTYFLRLMTTDGTAATRKIELIR